MATVGHVESDFKTELTNSGINNTFLELTVLFKVKMQIVIPSFSEETLVQQEINVGGILMKGTCQVIIVMVQVELLLPL